MTIATMLIPLDGSSTAESTLDYVPNVAAADTLVRLLSVVEVYGPQPGRSEARIEEAETLTTYLEKQAERLRSAGFRVERHVARGAPATTILAEARTFRPDLLIMSTHGRGAASRVRLGHVADTVIREAECNTLVVGSRTSRHRPDYRSILIPLDGSSLSEQALAVGRDLLQVHAADLHLLHAVQVPAFSTRGSALAQAAEAREQAVKEAEEYLSGIAKGFSAARTLAEPGPPNEVILNYTQRETIDLIVMTTHGRGPLNRMAVGGDTDMLIGGPAAVLIVRP